jgi:hypothetical protein
MSKVDDKRSGSVPWMPDPEDLLDPAVLVQEAGRHLLSALAAVDEISQALRGESPPPRKPRCNVVPFPARPRNRAS